MQRGAGTDDESNSTVMAFAIAGLIVSALIVLSQSPPPLALTPIALLPLIMAWRQTQIVDLGTEVALTLRDMGAWIVNQTVRRAADELAAAATASRILGALLGMVRRPALPAAAALAAPERPPPWLRAVATLVCAPSAPPRGLPAAA